MNYTKPSYYDQFKCIAGECPDTCCAGWEIVIDEETMERYKKMDNDLKDFVLPRVDVAEGVYKRCGNRCAFLNEDNLCELIIKAGEDKLCRTCDKYPRHFEEYGNLMESLISISCPVVAKMIIDRKEIDSFLLESDSEKPLSKDVDKKLLSSIYEIRKEIFSVLSNRKDDIKTRIKKILAIGETVQPLIYKYEKLGVKRYIPFYKSNISKKVLRVIADRKWLHVYEGYSKKYSQNKEQQKNMRSYMEMYTSLENINDSWPKLVKEVIESLYNKLSDEEYCSLKKDFGSYMQYREYEYEHLLIYFVYAYVLGGVYDYNIQGMVKFAVVSTLVIMEMGFAHWVTHNKEFDVDAHVKYAYLYSRQVEHSDNNVLCLEGIFTAHPHFSIENIYEVL